MKRVYSLLLSAILLAGTTWVAAQEYPSKPVRLIVPFAPGGGNDIVARAIAQQLSASLGRQFVVDNRAGAGGVVGAELAAKSPADGYTLFLGGVGSHAVNPNSSPPCSTNRWPACGWCMFPTRGSRRRSPIS